MKRFFLLFIIGILVQSCARVGSPIGGAKDTLAPQVIGSNIDTTRVNVRRDIKELRIDFNEYITLKDINKNLNISPPIKNIKRILPSNIANKYMVIQWTDTLQANTTYNFNFGNAIVDNSEGNPLRYYNFAFSTGEKLDDLYISGEVTDGFTIKKKSSSDNKMVVGLYQLKDSMDYRQKPYYITKVDDDGYYELNYLAPGKYKIIAFDDDNENSIYNPGKEKIAFRKDTVTVEKSISGLNLKLYPSKKPFKKPEFKDMAGGVMMLFEGNPDEVKVLSVSEKLKDIKVTHTPKSDSVKIWFDAVKSDVGQTVNEKLEFSYDTGKVQDTVSTFFKYNKKNVMNINSDNGGSLLPPKTDFKILSNYIVDKINFDKWSLKIDSTIVQPFTAKISETNPYQILIQSDFISGKKYHLTIPKTTISSYFDKNPDSKRFDFEVDKIENYGLLKVILENAPDKKYWLQLLDSSEKPIYQKYTSGSEVTFDVLKPGEYILRILVDNNENKYWDEADFENGTFAEDSYIYYKTALIRPLWTSKETWDLKDVRVLDTSKMGTTTTTDKNTKSQPTQTRPTTNTTIQNNNSGTRGNGRELQLNR
ncbi:Ig-like domain-containing protein [Chryseobacterium luquanense]|uniref:Ig-like domain-containing protein n=1 Tax=Chryseobacterium luquanense TaxID=2983766 RepID=A0ABT3Y8R1_9FLAO|nr:Ig-like domain-containing protein [Chryseobacterium luquanense]MCX8534436.1 Ig-like domain-containing protein [Chryseobacterium luquanense]